MIQAGILILATAAALTGPLGAVQNAAPQGAATLEGCLVSLIEEVQVPAREPGVLDALEATEGLEVEANMLLGHIDDTEPQMELAIAKDDYEIARVQAGNNVSVRLATKAAWVAWADHQTAVEANEKAQGAISQTEVRRLQFDYERAGLAIEEAKLRHEIDGLTANARKTQLDAARSKVERREIHSPIDGVIVEVMRHAGEWVNPGDPIFRVIGLNQLRIEGFLDSAQFDAGDVSNRPVTVKARLARGREATFRGKIVFVDPAVRARVGDFRIWAEVENRQENQQWLLRPGMNVSMSIQLRPASRLSATPVATPDLATESPR